MTFAGDIVPGSLVEIAGTYCHMNGEESLQYVVNALTSKCVYINVEKRYVAIVIARGMLPELLNGTEVCMYDCEALLVQIINRDEDIPASKSAYVKAWLKSQLVNSSALYVVYAHEWFPSVTLVS